MNASHADAVSPEGRGLRARRLAVPAAMLCLGCTPLFVSIGLADPVLAQGYFAIFAIFLGWALYLPHRLLWERRLLARWTMCDAWVGIHGAALLLSVALSPTRLFSLHAAILPLVLILFYFFLREILSSVDAEGRLVAILLLAGGVVATLGCLQYFGIELLPYSEERATSKQVVLSTLGNPNFVASFLGPLCFLIPLALLRCRGRRSVAGLLPVFSIYLIFAYLACIVMTGARGVWLGLAGTVGGLAVVMIAARGRLPLWVGGTRLAWKALLAVGAALFVLVLLLLVPNPLVRSRFDLAERLLSSREIRTRLHYWAVTGEVIHRQPTFGIGYNRFSATFWNEARRMQERPENAVYREYLLRVPSRLPGYAHNEYIEIAAEQGLIGLAAFLGMLAWFAANGVMVLTARGVARERKVAVTYLLAALSVLLLDSLFGFPLQLPASGLVFWTVLALLATESRRSGIFQRA